jgi:NodT family efflux transporter outer membrane factor (OMF) lipoprotein
MSLDKKFAIMRGFPVIAVLGIFLLFFGCAVGPKYQRPIAPSAPSYKELVPNDQWKTATPDQALLRTNWWEIFDDPQLNALESMVDVSNQNVAQAEARFRAARALAAYNRSNYYPTIGVTPAASSTALSKNLGARSFGGGVFNLFSIPFSVNWEPNFWGSISLAVRNAEALAQVSAADLENMRLSMRADLAISYFQALGADMQIHLLNETIVAYEKALQLTLERYNNGVSSKIDVVQAQAQLESTRTRLSEATMARSQYEHAIAVLAGQSPSSFSLPAGRIVNLPPSIPVGLPSQLLERRPDISSAERLAASANAQIGLAEVAFYPLMNLTGGGGLQSSSLGSLFSYPSRFWSLGASAAQTLFDFGRRRSLAREAEANYDAAVAGYRQTVLFAFQNVEDQLAALRLLAQESSQQEAAVKASQEALKLEIIRYKEGTDSYLNVIISQAIALANQVTAVEILQRRMTAAVELVRAIGGGWTESDLPKP